MPSSMVLRHVAFVVFLRSVLRLLAIANVVPSSQILVSLMMEALRSYNPPKYRFLQESHSVTSQKTAFSY
jgi:hypothetical protein